MKPYFGIIMAAGVENFLLEKDGKGSIPMEEHFVKALHYPDCQQLVIWLPEPGLDYESLSVLNEGSAEPVIQWPVAEKLSGSVQLIWDTLELAPGNYRVEISRQGRTVHAFSLTKYEEGVKPERPPAPAIVIDPDAPPIVYRDGFGNILENEDLVLRERVIRETYDKITRRLEYRNMGRGGTIIYHEGTIQFELYYEIGGGDCICYIDIPSTANWEKATGTPIGRRDDIIHFIAERAHADQASSSSIRMSDTSISFHKK